MESNPFSVFGQFACPLPRLSGRFAGPSLRAGCDSEKDAASSALTFRKTLSLYHKRGYAASNEELAERL